MMCAAALLAAALPPTAGAKELQAITLCGPSECRTFDDRETLRQVPSGGETTRMLGSPAPYYGLTFGHLGGHTSFGMYYVPSANALVGHDQNGVPQYHPIDGASAANVMRRLTRGLEPFAAPRVTSVRLGSRVVTGSAAQTYLELFSLKAARDPDIDWTKWLSIDLRSRTPSPWTFSPQEFAYSADANALLRGWEVVPLDERTAENLEAARALDARPGRTLLWPFGLALVGALALAGLQTRLLSREN